MRVKATKPCYYGHKRRKSGDVFDLSDKKHFSKVCMVEVKPSKKNAEPEPEPEVPEADPVGDDQDVI